MTAEATPEDQGGLVRHFFFFLGFVPLLSWNFFTMLTGYWMFKFRDPQTALNGSSPNATQTASLNDEVMNALQVDFTSYMVGAIMHGQGILWKFLQHEQYVLIAPNNSKSSTSR